VAYPNEHFMWEIVFPSSTTVSVCATAFQRGNGWGDASLKGLPLTHFALITIFHSHD
jgi:hypothetical protein